MNTSSSPATPVRQTAGPFVRTAGPFGSVTRNRHATIGLLTVLLSLPILGSSSGCTIPSASGDIDYPTYGGAWQRTRRDSGRVGSIFDPAGARTATMSPRDLPEGDEQARSERDSIFSSPGVVPDEVDSPRSIDDPFRQRGSQTPPSRDTIGDETNQIRYQRRSIAAPLQ